MISRSVSVPVIASGGAGSMAHFKEVFRDGAADAALAAGLFHRGELRIPDLKGYLFTESIPVRL
jgi:cyclase